MTALVNHFTFEFRTGIREKSQLLMNYLFPLSFYFIISLFMGQINPGFIDTMIPGMIVFTAISAAVLGMPNPLVSARESGIYRSFKINGIPAASIIGIPAVTTGIHIIIVAIIITATAPLFFNAPAPLNWPGFLLITLLITFTATGFGVLIGVISSNTRVTILWSQLIFLPSMMIGGIMMPHNLLPPVMAKISLLLPATYAMNAFQGIAFGQATDLSLLWSVVVLLTAGILAFALAQRLFSWDSRNGKKSGRIALAALVLVPMVAGLALM